MDRGLLYSLFCNAFKEAHNELMSRKEMQDIVNDQWRELKARSKSGECDLDREAMANIHEWENIREKNGSGLIKINRRPNQTLISTTASKKLSCAKDVSRQEKTTCSSSVTEANKCKTPAQSALREKITVESNKLQAMYLQLESDDVPEEDIRKQESKIKKLKQVLEAKQQGALRQQRLRNRRRLEKQRITNEHSDVVTIKYPKITEESPCVNTKDELDRSVQQTQVLQTIRNFVDQVPKYCTVDDVTDELRTAGYSVNESAIYLRLLPLSQNECDGKLNKVDSLEISSPKTTVKRELPEDDDYGESFEEFVMDGKKKAPAQSALMEEIASKRRRLDVLYKKSGSSGCAATEVEIRKLEKKLNELKSQLEAKRKGVLRQQRLRLRRKLEKIEFQDATKWLPNPNSGVVLDRSDSLPESDHLMLEPSDDEDEELFIPRHKLDDLTEELRTTGANLANTETYFRLLSQASNFGERKRQNVIPVRSPSSKVTITKQKEELEAKGCSPSVNEEKKTVISSTLVSCDEEIPGSSSVLTNSNSETDIEPIDSESKSDDSNSVEVYNVAEWLKRCQKPSSRVFT